MKSSGTRSFGIDRHIQTNELVLADLVGSCGENLTGEPKLADCVASRAFVSICRWAVA